MSDAATQTLSPSDPVATTTDRARRETLLSPRFYRTDYKALSRLDISPVRREWDEMMAEFARDENRAHFRQEVDFDAEGVNIPDDLRDDFLDFLVTSVTSEYSGCVLYQEIQKNVDNPDIADLCGYMARDESRHAGFINRCLKHLGMAVDLGFLKREKDYTFFKPKYIFYATYLSEKIGYARYITIFRHLEKNPEYRFHPIFRWFQEWCNDEFRHGEAFALIMRAHPELLRGHNRLWIRFFLLAVYATMYVRDHTRPRLYLALGIDPTEYDYRVFDICTEITKQIFPVTLDTDNPKFREGLETLRRINEQCELLAARGGALSLLRRGWLKAHGGLVFARLYLLPVNSNELPNTVRMQPAW